MSGNFEVYRTGDPLHEIKQKIRARYKNVSHFSFTTAKQEKAS